MSMDKVASSPALPTIDGWPADESPLNENEAAALNVALGVGISVSATVEEPKERHTVSDLASLEPTLPLPLSASTDSSGVILLLPQELQKGSTLSLKLHTLAEMSESAEVSTANTDSDSEEHSHASSNKVASFYIGDDQGCTRDLPPAGAPEELPNQQQQLIRRVQIRDQQTKEKTLEFTPPDGGYGWVIALAACVVNMWIVGFIKSYGVLYVHVRGAFPEASAYHASWLPALLSTIGLIVAPVTGTLCRMFTSRKVSFVGGLLCFLGLLLGSFATSMNLLILSAGVLTGLGAGLTTTPGVLIVSLYFEKRRALASAICVSGNALGGFFMPPLVDYLLEAYGFRGTLMILAAMQLHICAASVFYRPIRQHAMIQAREKANQPKDAESTAPVPEYNKLLPNAPASPRVGAAPMTSAPGTPLTRSHVIFQKMVRKRLASVSTTDEDKELQGQVSFLRSTSMMNSIPDLTRYARSWSISGERSSMGSRSSIRMAMGSKSSLSRLSIGTSSKSSLSKLAMVSENKHQPLIRLTSDGDQKVVRHPTLLRLASEEDGSVMPRNLSGVSIRLSQPRLASEARPHLVRQSSRRVQERIMTAVKEQDTDSQVSDEHGEQTSQIEGDDKPTEEKPFDKLDGTDDEKEDENDEDQEEDTEEERVNCCYDFVTSCFDLSLFKNPLFIMVSISVFFMASGAPHALFFLPAYAESVDIPSSKTPQMLSISSIVDLVGRLGIGFVSDLGIFRISDLYFISATAAGVSVLLVPQMTSFSTLSAVLSLYGFGVGAWFVLIPTLLARHHGAARLASSYGLVRLLNGCMNFISPQVNGLLVDATGSFVACYYFMGSFMVVSAVLLLVEPFLVVRVNKKEEKKKELEQAAKNQA